MHPIFQPYTIGALELKNRFVRSATGENRAELDGVLKEEIFPIYEELAEGGVGLIISGHMYVDQNWKCGEKQTGISGDHQIPGLRRFATACQRNNTRVIAQINHAARPPHDSMIAPSRSATPPAIASGGISGSPTASMMPERARPS